MTVPALPAVVTATEPVPDAHTTRSDGVTE